MAPRGPTPPPVADADVQTAVELRELDVRLGRAQDDIREVTAYAHAQVHDIRNLFAGYAEREDVTALSGRVAAVEKQVAQAEGAARILKWFLPLNLSALLALLAMATTIAVRLWGR